MDPYWPVKNQEGVGYSHLVAFFFFVGGFDCKWEIWKEYAYCVNALAKGVYFCIRETRQYICLLLA
jgi:hypothetical protein